MPLNALAENVLGTIGTICWTGQLIPQVWKSWRDKSTEGLSPWLVLIWGVSSSFLGAYYAYVIISEVNVPLMVQPQVFGFLTYISWGQCQYYDAKRSRTVSALMALAAMILGGGLEAALVFAVGPAYRSGTSAALRAMQFFGIFSSVLISLALIPQFMEIWRHREVVGISFIFMLVDIMGGLFSELSLVFKAKFDVFIGTTYSLVVLLDGIILMAALILNPRAARRRRREVEAVSPDSEDDSAGPVVDFPSDLQLATVVRVSMSSMSLRSLTQRH
ncbi:PQ loop repeat-domain-containing protein [Mycena maculata]|uniref:PQ loop repeat-domain-containing protein n=1 Tax=Mycena maculata TaxID=230809 RepID=A0AAD7IX35_9AGAR|nr:PQ loop repeat-domain-containing protein [Mycena maculata]